MSLVALLRYEWYKFVKAEKMRLYASFHSSNLISKLKQFYFLHLSLEQIAEYNRRVYEKNTGRRLDYNHPQNICDKAQQLKIFDAQPYKTQWTDKRIAKELAKELIGEEHIIKTLGVWDSFDDIDFDSLPDAFVLKANHGSGWNIIVEDKSKLDMTNAKNFSANG